MPKVFIIVLNWNGLHDTLECLSSLYGLEYPDFEVIVVDNGSCDDSVATIRQEYPRTILIENSTNLGFTGGNNIGARRALELGADYVWLLNNDTVVAPDSLRKLVDEAEKSPEIGLLSPTIYDYDSPGHVQFMGAYILPAKWRVFYVDDPNELNDELVRRNLILFGTALLIKRNVIETIGLLSEKYFAYYEDNDYSLRALRNNFRNMVVTDAHILHKGVRSTGGKNSPTKAFLMARNAYFLWKDNGEGSFFFIRYIGMMIGYAKYLSDEGNRNGYDACLNGVYAAFKGNTGACDPTIVAPSLMKRVFGLFVGWRPYFWINFFKGNVREIFLMLMNKAVPQEEAQEQGGGITRKTHETAEIASKRTIVENVFSNWANLAITIVIAFLISPIVVKTLGKEMYGIWVLIGSVTGYLTILDFGVNTALVRYISSSAAQNDHNKARSIYSTSLLVFGCISVGAILFSVVFGYFFQDVFNIQHISRLYLYAVFVICCMDLACNLIFTVQLGSLTGLQEFKFINGSSIVINVIKSIILVLFLKQGFSLLAIAFIQILTSLARSLVLYWKLRSKYPFISFSRQTINRDTFKLIYNYSIYSFVIAIALKLLFYTDSVLIGALLGISYVAFYAIPSSLLDYLEKFVWAMVSALVPVISAKEATGGITENSKIYIVGTRYVLLVSMPVVISLFYYGGDFIRLWMGPEFGERSLWVLRLLLLGYGCSFSQLIAHGILKGISKHRILAYILAAEALANLGMSLALAKPYGIEGVAFGTMVPLILASAAIIFYSCSLLKLKVRDYLGKAYTGTLLGICAAMAFVKMFPYHPESYLELFALSGCTSLCFLIIAFPLTLEREHREILGRSFSRAVYKLSWKVPPA